MKTDEDTTVRIEAGAGVVEVARSSIPGHFILRCRGETTGGVTLRADEAQQVIEGLQKQLKAVLVGQ